MESLLSNGGFIGRRVRSGGPPGAWHDEHRWPLRVVVTTTGASETVTLVCQDNGTFNATIDWGDGSTSAITTYNDADLAHTYTTAGTYEIEITGSFPNFKCGDMASTDKPKIKAFWHGQDHSWGTQQTSGFSGLSAVTWYPSWDMRSVVTAQDLVAYNSALKAMPRWHFRDLTFSWGLMYSNYALNWFPTGVYDGVTATPANNMFTYFSWGSVPMYQEGVYNLILGIYNSGINAPASGTGIDLDAYNGTTQWQATYDLVDVLNTRGWTVTIGGTPI